MKYLLVSIVLSMFLGDIHANPDVVTEINNFESCTKIYEYLKKNKLNEIALEDAPYIGKYLENEVIFESVFQNWVTGEYLAWGTTCKGEMKVVLEDTPRILLEEIEIGKKYTAGFNLKRPRKSKWKDIPRQPLRFEQLDTNLVVGIKSNSKEVKARATIKGIHSIIEKRDWVETYKSNGIDFIANYLYSLAPEQFNKCYKSKENAHKKLKKKFASLKKAEIYTYVKSTFKNTTALKVKIQPESLYKSCIKKEDLEKIYLKKVSKAESTIVGYKQITFKYTK